MAVGRIGAAPAAMRRPRHYELPRQRLGSTAIHAPYAPASSCRSETSVLRPLLGEGVANPKCSTCRFFQENDLPGSGWCHHPQRKVSSDVKILVRRSELACRDDWSRSLWQPATGKFDVGAGTAHSPNSGPLLPTSEENLRAVLNRDLKGAASPAESAGEDVLLSEARIVSERQEPWEPPSRPFPAGNFDPRTALFKAREAYREKVRANAVASRQAAVEANAGTFDRAESAPLHEGTAEEESIRKDVGPIPQTPTWTEEFSAETKMANPTRGRAGVAAPVEAGEGVPEPPRASPGWSFEDTEQDEEPIAAQGLEVEVCSPDLPAVILDDDFSPESPRVMLATSLPAWFRADLPRVCRACRDFRPAADGQRGWCANAWAFTHRQLVQEDDVAPCHSAIGDWWAPVDDVWMVAADVSSHGRATPLLDRMIGEESGQRRRS
jgi:hypothetical protein